MIHDRVRDVVARVLDVPRERISDQMSRDHEAAWDSFNHLLLVSALEADFGIVLTMAQIESIRCVGDLVAIVTAKGKHS